jgi:UDP-N-acetylmuramoyl-tripeptide--D-alanyl-D-alanine ligase
MSRRLADAAWRLRHPVVLRAQAAHRLALVLGPLLAQIAGAYRRVWIPDCRIVVVIVSFGKTTTTKAIARVLSPNPDARVRWNLQAAVAASVLRLGRGAPPTVIEVGIGKRGQMRSFARMLKPDVVVVTSIGSEHEEHLGSLEDIRREKAAMIEALRPTGLAVLNADDPNVLWMASRTRARVVRCGRGPANDVSASRITLGYPPRMSLRVRSRAREFGLETRLAAYSLVFPILAAVAVGEEEGIPVATIRRRLEALEAAPRRMESSRLGNGAWALVDDRKALPETVFAALETLADLPARRKWAVIGEIGLSPSHDAREVYRSVGRELGRVSDHLVLTTADAAKRELYMEGATEAGLSADNILAVDGNLRAALDELRRGLAPGDVVLVKGRFAERLARLALALEGTDVRCWVSRCDVRPLSCRGCSVLTRG